MNQTQGIRANEKPVENDFSYVYAENKDKGFIKVTKAMMKVLLGVATKLSELENDEHFVDNTVSNLKNYYLKTETYSKEELDDKIALIPKFSVKVVYALPFEDISESTIYLVPANDGSDNLYTEYINVNGLWEILGTQKIANIQITKEAIEEALGYTPADEETINALLAYNQKNTERSKYNRAFIEHLNGVFEFKYGSTLEYDILDIQNIFTYDKPNSFGMYKLFDISPTKGNLDINGITFTYKDYSSNGEEKTITIPLDSMVEEMGILIGFNGETPVFIIVPKDGVETEDESFEGGFYATLMFEGAILSKVDFKNYDLILYELKNGGGSGATAEQLAQIEKNKTDISQLSDTIGDYIVNLNQFGIYNDGTHPEETTDGINDALQYCYENNITNIVFPKGTYLIDSSRTAKGFEWVQPWNNAIKTATGIAYRSNQSVDWSDSIVQGVPVSNFVHYVMCIFTQKNVDIKNCTIIGDLDNHITPLKISSWEQGIINTSGVNEASEVGIRTTDFITQLEDGTALPDTFRIAMFLGILKEKDFNICWYDSSDSFISTETYKFAKPVTKPTNATKFKLSLPEETYTDRTIIVSIETTEVYPTREFGQGIEIAYAENVLLKNLDISKCVSDAVLIDNKQKAMSKNITFDNVSMHDCRRQGISFCGGANNTVLRNCKIYNIQGTSPEAGIDFEHYVESHKPGGFGPVFIVGCEFSNCNGGWINNFNGYNIYVDECKFHDDKYDKGFITSAEGHDIFYNKCKFTGSSVSVTTLGKNSYLKDCIVETTGKFHFHATELLENTKVTANHVQIYGNVNLAPIVRNCDIKITGDADIDSSFSNLESIIKTKVCADNENKFYCSYDKIQSIDNCDLVFNTLYNVSDIRNSALTQLVDRGYITGGVFDGCTINLINSDGFIGANTNEKTKLLDCIINIEKAVNAFQNYSRNNIHEYIRCEININGADKAFMAFNIINGSLINIVDCVFNNNSEYAWNLNPYFYVADYRNIYKSYKCIRGLKYNGKLNIVYGWKTVSFVSERFIVNNVEMVTELKNNKCGMQVGVGDVILYNGENYLIKKGGIFTVNKFIAGTSYGTTDVFYHGSKAYMVSTTKTIDSASIFSTSDVVGQEVATGVFCVGDLAEYSGMDSYSKTEIDEIMGSYVNDISALLGGGI